ncbi:MAG TPA: DUF6570 domain-containing protein [Amoebophilaceae bacterium]|nr:DUF6570 domain-containing protein [Amoebophilaceae bacterium]
MSEIYGLRVALSRTTKISPLPIKGINKTDTARNVRDKYCAKYNLRAIDIPGDGSCQYAAVLTGLDHLGRNPGKWNVGEFRNALAAYVDKQMRAGAHTTVYQTVKTRINVEEQSKMYYKRHNVEFTANELLRNIRGQNPGTRSWGDDVTLMLMHLFLGVHFTIVTYAVHPTTNWPIVDAYSIPSPNPSSRSVPFVFLFLQTEKHYDALLPRDAADDIMPDLPTQHQRRLERHREKLQNTTLYQKNCTLFKLKKVTKEVIKKFVTSEESFVKEIAVKNQCIIPPEELDTAADEYALPNAILTGLRSQGYSLPDTADDLESDFIEQVKGRRDLYKDQLQMMLRQRNVPEESYLETACREGDEFALRVLADCLGIVIHVLHGRVQQVESRQRTRSVVDQDLFSVNVENNPRAAVILLRLMRESRPAWLSLQPLGTAFITQKRQTKRHVTLTPPTLATSNRFQPLSEGVVDEETGVPKTPMAKKRDRTRSLTNTPKRRKTTQERRMPQSTCRMTSEKLRDGDRAARRLFSNSDDNVDEAEMSSCSTINRDETEFSDRIEMRAIQRSQKNLEHHVKKDTWPETITDETIDSCVDEFLRATGDDEITRNFCSVCAIRVLDNRKIHQFNYAEFESKYLLVLHKTIDRSQIKHEGQPGSAWKNSKDGPTAGMFCDIMDDYYLEKAGITTYFNPNDETFDHTFEVCDTCVTALKNKRLPKMSIANGNYFGPVPPPLKDLTIIEQLLISRIRTMMYVVSLKDAGGNMGYKCLRGNCVAFMQDQSTVQELLPPPIDSIGATIQISLIGTSMPSDTTQLKHILRVRRNHVKHAIDHIIHLRSQDKDKDEIIVTRISLENIDELPTDDIPPQILQAITVIDNPKAVAMDEAAHAGYANYGEEEANTGETESQPPTTIDLETYGVIDKNAIGINDELRTRHALANLPSHSDKKKDTRISDAANQVIAVTRDKTPVNEYNNKHLWYDAFPVLFPNRKGAPEGEHRLQKVGIQEWIAHVLNIRDDRFRKHAYFLFYLANMLKRRETCLLSKVQLKTSAKKYAEVAAIMRSLSYTDLRDETIRAEKGEPIKNKELNKLTDTLKAVGTRVKGSTYARLACRQEILSMQLRWGLPRIFLTINPHDYNSPLLFFINGKKETIGGPFPKKLDYNNRRSTAISDPVAAAKFFHIVISKTLEILIGYERKDKMGVLGKVRGYYGTVETQGRGTLHFHCLIWLKDFPHTETFYDKLKCDEYRDKVKEFIDNICTASLIELHNIPPTIDVNTYIKPSDPLVSNDDTTYRSKFENTVGKLAHKNQIHRHSFTCYKFSKKVYGKNKKEPKCRFNFDGDGKKIIQETRVAKDGSITLKRNHGMLNDYNPAIMYCIRSNMDIRFIPGSRDSRAIGIYITEYITKNALTTHNIMTIISSVMNKIGDDRVNADNDDACNLVLRCLNKINVNHEISSPECAQYLLKTPDHYTSEDFAPLFVGDLLKSMEALTKKEEEPSENLDIIMVNGVLNIVNQRIDYISRSDKLENVCLYEFVSDYKKRKITEKPRGPPYLLMSTHPQHETHHMVYLKNKKVVPNLLKIPPIQKESRDDYERMMLILFVPFRDIADLQFNTENSWKQAFEYARLNNKISSKMNVILKNLTDIHGAMEQREMDHIMRSNADDDSNTNNDNREYFEEEEVPMDAEAYQDVDDALEELIENNQAALDKESVSATEAWAALKEMLNSDAQKSHQHIQSNYTTASTIIGMNIHESHVTEWEKQIKLQELKINEPTAEESPVSPTQPQTTTAPSEAPQAIPMTSSALNKLRDDIKEQYTLNTKQALAYSLVVDHLIASEITTTPQKPFRFLLLGEGGTGKSQVINSIRTFFHTIGKSQLLRLTASTGKAAALIKGTTIHSLVAWSRTKLNKNPSKMPDKTKMIWKRVRYLIIDECSMIGLKFLSYVSQRIKEAQNDTSSKSFGNVSVVLVGDFFQLDPVGEMSLITPAFKFKTTADPQGNLMTGKVIFSKEFLNVIILSEQMRQADDPDYVKILKNLRYGIGTTENYDYLMKKIIKPGETSVDVFRTRIITTTNPVKDRLNDEMITQLAKMHDQEICIITAEDTFSKAQTQRKVPTKIRNQIRNLTGKACEHVPGRMRLTIGMPIMITSNISVTLGITNGSIGVL